MKKLKRELNQLSSNCKFCLEPIILILVNSDDYDSLIKLGKASKKQSK